MHKQAFIDLHTHSTASDGSMTPAELVRHAFEGGLAAVALTDHDTLNGVKEALDEGEKLGMEIIPGVEISVDFTEWHDFQEGLPLTEAKSSTEPEMHLLGYFFNDDYERNLQKTLDELKEKREQRNPKIIARLNELGFDITLSEARELAAGGLTGRPHIARVLVNKGYAADIAEAFDKYLASGRPAFFKKEKLTPAEGISVILEAGGVPVLAHPIYLNLDAVQLDKLLERLAGYGLKGIEAYYTENTEQQTETLITLAKKHNLCVTGGSDFHGSFKTGIEIGVGRGSLKIPYDLLSNLRRSRDPLK